MREYKIREVSHNQIAVHTDGWAFDVLFGNAAGGHYIAIPSWGICVPAGKANDTFYNRERLSQCKDECVANHAAEIAAAIAETWGKE
ncbi:MAG: hypothetical protein NC299_09095 [Lachnospiraceae bacterium]|nr:hypothetical protein [Lachnospiraceae bacterium]